MEAEVWRQLGAGTPGIAGRWRAIRESARAGEAGGGGHVGASGRAQDADSVAALTFGQVQKLRASHGAAMARFVSLQDELSRRARKRFPGGRPLFWTSKGLEQATPARVSEYRAQRFAEGASGDFPVWDACCGVGSDAVAILLALQAGGRGGCLVATDWDADSARCAAANLLAALEEAPGTAQPTGRATGHLRSHLRGHVAATCDLRRPPISKDALGGALILLDPDRRPDGEHREPRPERWAPPLSETLRLALSARGACVKLPPSLDATAEGLDREMGSPWQLEWISLDGEMKELALWTGSLAGSGGKRIATALRTAPSVDVPAQEARYGSDEGPSALPDAWPVDRLGPGSWLVELDPTLWQSELAGNFCAEHGLAPIATEIRGMFLVAKSPPNSPLARSWPILECVSADRKRVRKALRDHGIGPVTVKKRNHPKTSMELEAAFRGPGDHEGLLAVFRVPGGSIALILGRGPEVGP